MKKKRHFQKNGIGNEKNNNLIMNLYLHIKHGMLVRAIPDHQSQSRKLPTECSSEPFLTSSQHGGISTKHSEPTSPA